MSIEKIMNKLERLFFKEDLEPRPWIWTIPVISALATGAFWIIVIYLADHFIKKYW